MVLRIGLLRAVNLGPHGKVAMADLKALLAGLGMPGQTLLQSGNIVFEAKSGPTGRLEATLEKAMADNLGLATEIFVRTPEEWSAMVAANPFPREAKADPGHLVYLALKAPLSADAVAALQKALPGRERFAVCGRDAYAVYPDGIGRSKLTNVFIERRLGTRTTGRNWNTVLKLMAMVG